MDPKFFRQYADLITEAEAKSVSTARILNKAEAFMKKQVQQNQQHIAGDSSVASAPDSSKFRAHRYGMIDYGENYGSRGSTHGGYEHWNIYVKIGSNVDRDVRDAMVTDFYNWFEKNVSSQAIPGEVKRWKDSWTGLPTAQAKLPDGFMLALDVTGGTAWTLYGIQVMNHLGKAYPRPR